jgi:Retrotransposon gag protein
MHQTPPNSGGPGRPGGPGGPGGPGVPQGPPAAAPAAGNADDRVMGNLPQVFDGERKNARIFLNNLLGYFRANSRVPGLNSPIRKISIALTLIQGPQVVTWVRDIGAWIDSLHQVDDDVQLVWDTFVQEFTEHFTDSQEQQRARLNLDRCKMRFPEVDQYITDFEELVRRVGYTIGSEETIGFFLNSLTPSILDAVVCPPFPTNYNEYKAKAVQHTKARQMVEAIRARRGIPNNCPQNSFNQPRNNFQPRNWMQRPSNQNNPQQPWRQPSYNLTTAPRPSYNNVQVPMDLSRTRVPNNRHFPRANQATTDGMLVRLPDKLPQKPKGPCFHCRKLRHFIRDCCSHQRGSTYVHQAFQSCTPSIHLDDSISYMNTNEDDMRSVPPLNLTPQATIASLKAQIDSLSLAENDSLIEMMGANQDFTPA